MEKWRTVPGTDGCIEVSDQGRVRSLLRGTPYILKTQPDKKGYRRLRVTINRQKLSFKLHRIVAEAFIPNPDRLPQVNHIDGDKDNNSVSNLEWVTNKQNARHAIENGLWVSVIEGANRMNASRRMPVIGMRGDELRRFESVGAAERFVNSRHVSDVLKGKRAHAGGWSFSYERR